MRHQVPREVAEDIGPFLSQLAEFGYQPTDSHYDSQRFGNYYVDLLAGKTSLRIVRDRSQYYIDAKSTDRLQESGILRAFDDRRAFEQAVLEWLRAA
jgi:hypothetical protein